MNRTDMKEGRTSKKRSSIAPRIVFFAALAVFVFSAVQLIRIYRNYDEADSSYEDLRSEFQEPGNEWTPEQEAPDLTWLLRMHEEYPDIIGWIRIPDTNVDYPVMYRGGPDGDSYYLTNDYSGAHSVNGSIFLETLNSPTLDDVYNVIYGHNMNSGAMFHDITSYMDPSFLAEHPEILLLVIEDDGASVRQETWRIFSAHRTQDDSEIYTVGYQAGAEAYMDLVQRMAAASDYDTGVEATGNDRVLTLSTCTNSSGNMRTVVHAVLVTE